MNNEEIKITEEMELELSKEILETEVMKPIKEEDMVEEEYAEEEE